jgi:HSP20 family protein
MTIITWRPLAELQELRQQINGLLDDRQGEAPLLGLVAQSIETPWMPAIELQETETALILRAHIPGLATDQLDIQVSENAVFLAGSYPTPPQHPQGIIRSEFHYGQFRRVLPLPSKVQQESVTAMVVNGLLTIHLPKLLPSIPNIIKVPVMMTSSTTAPPLSGYACTI